MSANDSTSPELSPYQKHVQQFCKSLDELAKISVFCEKYRLYRPKFDRADIVTSMTKATHQVYNAVMPAKITEHCLAFEANHLEQDKTKIIDMIEWCAAAEEFYMANTQVLSYIINEDQRKIREHREMMQRLLAEADTSKALDVVYVHNDTQLLLRINRLPHEMVLLIGEYLHKDLVVASVRIPSVDEMMLTLSKVPLPKLKKLKGYIEERYQVSWVGANGARCNIGRIRFKACADAIITSENIHPCIFGWCDSDPRTKVEFAETITGFVRVYEYHANIFKTAASNPLTLNKKCDYTQYANIFREEANHIVKFIRMIGKQKKVRRSRVVRSI